MRRSNLALLVCCGALAAGWAHDLKVGKYYRDRSKKLSNCLRLAIEDMDRKDVQFDDFTLIAMSEVIHDKPKSREKHGL